MTPAVSTKLTYEDYLLLPEDGRRHEIIDGEHYVNAAPNRQHQAISLNLTLALAYHVRAHALGQLFYAPFDVLLSPIDVVQPDLVFISNERLRLLDDANLKGAPDLAIEIVSPSSRRIDLVIKRKRYDLFGVTEYWIVDGELETVTIYRRGTMGLERVAEVGTETGGAITTPLLPGFSMDIAAVFAS
jgi:Uma2 family endonuclease